MEPETFLDGRVSLFSGDCLEVVEALPENSVDAILTDPPYHLTSIVKRFGKAGSAPAKSAGATGVYARSSKGFMGQEWDGGDIAFRPDTWAAFLRVLKPGGHLLAFAAARNYHRMAVAIEDAGFEIRDMQLWLYGSGFPKSHDVSKAIDKRRDWTALRKIQATVKEARTRLRISQSEAARRAGLIDKDESLGGGGFMWFETGSRIPTGEQWRKLKTALSIGDEFDAAFEEAEREVTGTVEAWKNRSNYALITKDGFRRDNPATEAAARWQGWGTALKPAHEPMCHAIKIDGGCLARAPLDGTVAENVMRHGTGALNIGGCTVLSGENGRWPANVATDGLDEDWSRYFYSAKADAVDRLGLSHPTVKPVELLRYYVRLITPPGGVVLDPFAGTGTTAQAAYAEGFQSILIERETRYQEEIRHRMGLIKAGPMSRRVAAAKLRGEASPAAKTPRDDAQGALFGDGGADE